MQFCSVSALKIYFAGPLFTPYERSFIDECAAALRADGFEVFVPHEHELAREVDVTAASIFAHDRRGSSAPTRCLRSSTARLWTTVPHARSGCFMR